MNNDLISVIVPIYNAEKYLNKCVESILNQTYKNLEIILVDDGSPDNCPKICDDFAKQDNRIKVIHKQNGGVSSSRNLGIKMARGKFIAFVDSDDFIEKNMYEKLYQEQQKDGFDIVFCRYNQVEDENVKKIFEERLQDFCLSKDIKFIVKDANLKYENEIIKNTSSVWGGIWRSLFRREIVENYSFNKNLSLAEDTLFLIEIFSNENLKISYCNEYLYNYVIHKNSLCRQNMDNKEKSSKLIKNTTIFTNEIKNKIKNSYLINDIINNYQFNAYLSCYLNFLNYKDKSLLKSIKSWNSNNNYKSKQKFTTRFKDKFLNFCVHYNLNIILKFINRFKKIG